MPQEPAVQFAIDLFPLWVCADPVLGGLRYRWRVLKSLAGSFPRECPVCDFQGMFKPAGIPPRIDAICPECGCAERHRLLFLAFERLRPFKRGDAILHFAPEARVSAYLRGLGVDYTSADLIPGRADVALDLHAIDRPSESIDGVVLIHVLEHVNDRAALSEIHRILRPGGKLVAMVPIAEGWADSFEDDEITSDRDRERYFGQFDHVRVYGRDFRDRIKAAGFGLSEFTLPGKESARYSIGPGETVFIGTK